MEAKAHPATAFVTLTYKDEYLTMAGNRPTVVPRDLDLWLHRVRKHKHVTPFKYFAIGEYGCKTERPHYHALLFGLDADNIQDAVHDTWAKKGDPIGRLTVDPIHTSHPAYVAHYTTKKISADKETEWLGGRHKEFTRRSRGLGHIAVPDLCSVYNTPAGERYLIENRDVHRSFETDGKTWPLDDFMQDKMRAHVGIPKREKLINWDNWDEDDTSWLDEGPARDAKRKPITAEVQRFATIKADRIGQQWKNQPHGVL